MRKLYVSYAKLIEFSSTRHTCHTFEQKQSKMLNKTLYTVTELIEFYDISRTTLMAAMKKKQLRYFQRGKGTKVFIDIEDFRNFLRSEKSA